VGFIHVQSVPDLQYSMVLVNRSIDLLMRSLLSFAFKFMHGKQKPVTLLLVKLMPLDTQWNLYLVVTHWTSLVPRLRPAFCHL